MLIDTRYDELADALAAGLVNVEKSAFEHVWIFTVAGTPCQGTAATEHQARIAGTRAALRLINQLIDSAHSRAER